MALATATALGRLPALVVALYACASLIALASYARDKRAAIAGRRRTPESTLHLIALFGGWPGALLAQQWLRHKSVKTSFLVVFWITVALNLAVLLGFAAAVSKTSPGDPREHLRMPAEVADSQEATSSAAWIVAGFRIRLLRSGEEFFHEDCHGDAGYPRPMRPGHASA